jgi:two-component system LytT family response regulator
VYAGNASHLLRESLSALEQELDQQTFVRIHRSALVNVTYVRELRREPEGHYSIVLRDGTRLRVSERRRAAVLKALGARAAT